MPELDGACIERVQDHRCHLHGFRVSLQIVVDKQVHDESSLLNTVQVNVELSVLGFDDDTHEVSVKIAWALVQFVECQQHIQHLAQEWEREELVQVLISIRDLILDKKQSHRFRLFNRLISNNVS